MEWFWVIVDLVYAASSFFYCRLLGRSHKKVYRLIVFIVLFWLGVTVTVVSIPPVFKVFSIALSDLKAAYLTSMVICVSPFFAPMISTWLWVLEEESALLQEGSIQKDVTKNTSENRD
jgi:hypothetical protein